MLSGKPGAGTVGVPGFIERPLETVKQSNWKKTFLQGENSLIPELGPAEEIVSGSQTDLA